MLIIRSEMKVLIVDDNKNNRMILNLLLEDYQEKNSDVKFDISEAEDGAIALENVKSNNYDLIFMDIMMPNMDGISATTAIRRIDKKAMIIAVSAIDDDERKKVILNNGAEDYIPKPVNGDIFSVRLHSYLKLIQARQTTISAPKKSLNLFTKDIYPYHLHFHGENEDMISSFWEYYLLNNTPYDGISDMVRFIYDMALSALEKDSVVNIYEENSDDYMYITLETQTSLDPDAIMHYADKNNFMDNYKLEGKRLSTMLSKEKVVNFIERSNIERRTESDRRNSSDNKIKDDLNIETPTVKLESNVTIENQVFDILEPEDFQDFKEYISKLNSLLLILGSNIEEHEVDEMVITLLQVSKTASSYNDLYTIGSVLGNLGAAINNNKAVFMEKSSELGPLAIAFGGDLSQWFKSLFIEGAPSIDFLDDSITSDAKMIESFIVPQSDEDEDTADVDDIFDF